MLLRRKGTVVWLSFVMHFLIELYSTAPFGTILFSGTIATLIIYWLAESVFTNSTVLVALGLSTIGLIVYRAIYTVFLVASSVVLDTNTGLLQGSIMLVFLWELLFTSILVGILYMAIEFYKTRKIEFV